MDPIETRLKTEKQVNLARLEDTVVEALFEVDSSVFMHGDTAIWRCYNGNRFSEDIDIYANEKQMDKILKNLTWSLSKRNVNMEHPKYTKRVITVFNESARTKLEAMVPTSIKPVQTEYERTDGSKIFITTLSAEDLLIEKISTYEKRGYVRDLYDIYHLSSISKMNSKLKKELSVFLTDIKKPSEDSSLSDLIYAGATPSFDTMVKEIERQSE